MSSELIRDPFVFKQHISLTNRAFHENSPRWKEHMTVEKLMRHGGGMKGSEKCTQAYETQRVFFIGHIKAFFIKRYICATLFVPPTL